MGSALNEIRIDRIRRSLEYIEENLKGNIKLSDVADIAGFSLFHFHRVFGFITGFGVGEYIRKRRLSISADELSQTDKRIIDIALDCMFESQESFTRSFKNELGLTPGQYRKRRPNIAQLMPARLNIILTGGISMEPVIKEIGELKLVGMKHFGTDKEIPGIWMKFMPLCGKIQNLTKPEVGIEYSWGEPVDGKYWMMMSMLVDDATAIPDGLESETIKAQKYAVFTHKGKIDFIGQTFVKIYKEWLPNSDFELSGDYNIQWYDERFKEGQSDDSEVDILIPIK